MLIKKFLDKLFEEINKLEGLVQNEAPMLGSALDFIFINMTQELRPDSKQVSTEVDCFVGVLLKVFVSCNIFYEKETVELALKNCFSYMIGYGRWFEFLYITDSQTH